MRSVALLAFLPLLASAFVASPALSSALVGEEIAASTRYPKCRECDAILTIVEQLNDLVASGAGKEEIRAAIEMFCQKQSLDRNLVCLRFLFESSTFEFAVYNPQKRFSHRSYL